MWFFGVVLLVFLLIFAASYLVYKLAFCAERGCGEDVFALPPGKQNLVHADTMRDNIRALLAIPYEQVYITSWDGTKLAARYYHRKDGAPLQLQFHGYRGNAVREYSGTFRMAEKLGLNSLVVDMRGHGCSGGSCVTLGIWESEDCLCWAEYAYQRFGRHTPVVFTGASMGATTVLMASSFPLPVNVKGIVADSPFSSAKAIIRKVCAIAKLPFWLGYPLAILGAGFFGRFAIWKGSALAAVSVTNKPILLIHGDADHFVPCDMSRELFAKCNAYKRLYLVHGAGHCLSYYTDPDGYYKALKRFFVENGIFAQD